MAGDDRGAVRRAADWLFVDRGTGRYVLGQFPNLSLIVFVLARGLAWVTSAAGAWGAVLYWVGTGALAWWAADELLRGVNPFRRMLGAVVLGFVVWGVVARVA
ncbi:MAG: hypothetical protein WCF36_19730 [Candidatus Nanopelagicales bacterium]